MACTWERVPLGRTGVKVTPIGLGSSYGVGERDVERAFERGVNYLYWGSVRKDGFGRALRTIARRDREGMALVIQSYARAASLLRPSLERALRAIGTEYADFLLLGWWNDPPPRRIVDAARRLVETGKARHVMISSHHRPTFVKLAADPTYGAIMCRYNAAHPGAEPEVFAHLGAERPGVVAYTATCWGQLLRPALVPAGEPRPRGSDCYRFVLSNPAVDLVLAGPRDAAELDEALSALDRGPMDADELAWMRRIGKAVHDAPSTRKLPSPVELLDRAARLLSRD